MVEVAAQSADKGADLEDHSFGPLFVVRRAAQCALALISERPHQTARPVARWWVTLSAALLPFLAFPSQAMAQDRIISDRWIIQSDDSLLGERLLRNGDYLLKQRLLPEGLVELTGDAPAAGLKSGDQLVEMYASGALVFCDPRPHPPKMLGLVSPASQPCLIDGDRDGRLEGWFLVASSTRGILEVSQDLPKTSRPIAAVSYRHLDPERFAMDLFVGVQYRSKGMFRPVYVFDTNFGSDKRYDRMTKSLTFDYALKGADLTVLGAKFKILGETSDGIRVQTSQTMPRQSFSVFVIGTL